MADTETHSVSHSEEAPPAPVASSQETTSIAEKLGEHNVQVQQATQTAEQAAATSEAAAASAAAASEAAAHSHEDFVTKAEFSGFTGNLTKLLEDRLPQPPDTTTPPAVETPPPPDDAPKSREKKAPKKSLSERFYGK